MAIAAFAAPSMQEINPQWGARLTDLGYNRTMDNRTKLDDEIKTAEQHQTFK